MKVPRPISNCSNLVTIHTCCTRCSCNLYHRASNCQHVYSVCMCTESCLLLHYDRRQLLVVIFTNDSQFIRTKWNYRIEHGRYQTKYTCLVLVVAKGKMPSNLHIIYKKEPKRMPYHQCFEERKVNKRMSIIMMEGRREQNENRFLVISCQRISQKILSTG